MTNIAKYKSNDNRNTEKENAMSNEIDKVQYGLSLETMKAHLGVFKDLKNNFTGTDAEEAFIRNTLEVVFDMAKKYYEVAFMNYAKIYGEQWNGIGSSGTDREGTTVEGEQAGASVPEAGGERGASETAEGVEPAGVGGGTGEGVEHDGGDRDGNDTDTGQ